MTVEDKRMAHDRMREAIGRCMGLFYAGDGMVGSRYPEWLQHLMHILVSPFRRYGLAANVTKSHTMMCQPGELRSGMSREAKALKYTGVRDSYRVRLQQHIS